MKRKAMLVLALAAMPCHAEKWPELDCSAYAYPASSCAAAWRFGEKAVIFHAKAGSYGVGWSVMTERQPGFFGGKRPKRLPREPILDCSASTDKTKLVRIRFNRMSAVLAGCEIESYAGPFSKSKSKDDIPTIRIVRPNFAMEASDAEIGADIFAMLVQMNAVLRLLAR